MSKKKHGNFVEAILFIVVAYGAIVGIAHLFEWGLSNTLPEPYCYVEDQHGWYGDWETEITRKTFVKCPDSYDTI